MVRERRRVAGGEGKEDEIDESWGEEKLDKGRRLLDANVD